MESMAGKFTEQLAGYWREREGEGDGEKREGEKWRKGEGEKEGDGKKEGSREWRAKCRDGSLQIKETITTTHPKL